MCVWYFFSNTLPYLCVVNHSLLPFVYFNDYSMSTYEMNCKYTRWTLITIKRAEFPFESSSDQKPKLAVLNCSLGALWFVCWTAIEGLTVKFRTQQDNSVNILHSQIPLLCGSSHTDFRDHLKHVSISL